MRHALLLLAVFGTVAFPLAGPVAAQQVNAPPGLSGVDEYLETVPGAGGAERPGGGSGPDGAPVEGEVEAKTEAAIPAATLRELERQGEDGARVARLAATNAPVGRPGTVAGLLASGRGAVKGEALRDDSGSGATGAIPAVFTGSTGAGLVFPLVLATLTLALALAAARRRRTP